VNRTSQIGDYFEEYVLLYNEYHATTVSNYLITNAKNLLKFNKEYYEINICSDLM